MNVWAAIAAATPVEKPTGTRPPQKSFSVSPTPTAFDPVAVLDELDLYWLNGSSSYFLRRIDRGYVRYIEMGSAEIRRKLRARGYNSRPEPQRGEFISQVDAILDAATESRVIDVAVNIAGTKAGVYDQPGGRVLVRESPRLIDPKPGEFTTIDELLTGLLGDQKIRFYCWLKIAYEALRAGERRPGQALIFIGPPDCGKSRIQHQIITRILAGRSADPKSFFFGRTDFNTELAAAEHLLIEEVPSSYRHEERLFFGERIKEIVADDTARLHKKNRDAVTISPFWRLSISLNDDPDKLRCLPPLSDDLADKIILFQAQPAPEFWKRFDNATDPRKAFREAIESELPAFANFLVNLVIPTSLQGRRYGVKSFIPPEVAENIFEQEPEHLLLLLIDKGIFGEEREGTGSWTGDAEDLKQTLCADGSTSQASSRRLLGAYPTACGQYLARLASKFPARFKKHRKAHWRGWIIQPPSS